MSKELSEDSGKHCYSISVINNCTRSMNVCGNLDKIGVGFVDKSHFAHSH